MLKFLISEIEHDAATILSNKQPPVQRPTNAFCNVATLDGLTQLIIDIRTDARGRKDRATSDKIRETLKAIHLQLKENTSWGRAREAIIIKAADLPERVFRQVCILLQNVKN